MSRAFKKRLKSEIAAMVASGEDIPAPNNDLTWIAEVHWANEQYGPVTPTIWHKQVRKELARKAAERHFERLKVLLKKLGVPHHRETVMNSEGNEEVGLILDVHRMDLDALAPTMRKNKLKFRLIRIMKKGAKEKSYPPLTVHSFGIFSHDSKVIRLPLPARKAAA